MQILEHPLYDLFAAAAASYKTSLRVLRMLLLVILSHCLGLTFFVVILMLSIWEKGG